MEVQYDSAGRMKYHPEYHHNHGKPYTIQELAYICSMYESATRRQVSMAVGRTEGTVAQLVQILRKRNQFEFYKNLER